MVFPYNTTQAMIVMCPVILLIDKPKVCALSKIVPIYIIKIEQFKQELGLESLCQTAK